MSTEVTQITVIRGKHAWVLYDSECRLCVGVARRVEGLLLRHDFALAPLQSSWVREQLVNRIVGGPPVEMALFTADGQWFGGAEALAQIARRIWWSWPLYAVARAPGIMRALRVLYGWLAARRHCIGGSCAATPGGRWLDWLALVTLPTLVLVWQARLEPWAFMWALAFALFLGCKWLTWRRAITDGARPSLARSLGYLLGWPGMDAGAFLAEGALTRPRAREWLLALAKTLFGTAVTWGCAQRAIVAGPLAAGWTGLIGLIFVLHFGLFHLLALAWQQAGVKAAPVMRAPMLATSLAEFWGRRWNVAFHLLVHDLAFRPLRRWLGRAGAMLAVFFLSGLIHELVISVPARGGYGLPVAYFIVQGLALLLERSPAGRAAGLGRSWIGWLFTFACTAGPVFWLFHPPFVINVILPFLKVIHAL